MTKPADIQPPSVTPASPKHIKRAAFMTALANGCSNAELARVACVSVNTARAWRHQAEKRMELLRNGLAAASKGEPSQNGTIASPDEAKRILSDLARSESTPPPYRVSAAARLLEDEKVDERPQMPKSVEEWMTQQVEKERLEWAERGMCLDCQAPFDGPPGCADKHADNKGEPVTH